MEGFLPGGRKPYRGMVHHRRTLGFPTPDPVTAIGHSRHRGRQQAAPGGAPHIGRIERPVRHEILMGLVTELQVDLRQRAHPLPRPARFPLRDPLLGVLAPVAALEAAEPEPRLAGELSGNPYAPSGVQRN